VVGRHSGTVLHPETKVGSIQLAVAAAVVSGAEESGQAEMEGQDCPERLLPQRMNEASS
jgi:hypothetical protein